MTKFFTNFKRHRNFAFTMAEILLSLTIIGVVAAITLPSLTGNINERTWNTQRKALYARMSQSLALMPYLNNYGEYAGTNTDGSVSTTIDTAAQAFVTELSNVMKINNICDDQHLADCGLVSYTPMGVNAEPTLYPTKLSELNPKFTAIVHHENGNTYTNPQNNIDTKVAAFETVNGESIAVYYNPRCIDNQNETNWHYSEPYMCANFVYDLNGKKGPNTFGKDVGFITAMYASNPVIIAPMPATTNAGSFAWEPTGEGAKSASAACTAQDPDYRLPGINELTAMFYNQTIVGIDDGDYWSSTAFPSDISKAWRQTFYFGDRMPIAKTHSHNVRCVKR